MFRIVFSSNDDSNHDCIIVPMMLPMTLQIFWGNGSPISFRDDPMIISQRFTAGAVGKAAPASSISNDRSSSWLSFPVFDLSCFSKRTFKELGGKVLKGERC